MYFNPSSYLKTRLLQTPYMFLVIFPILPVGYKIVGLDIPLAANVDLTFLVRSTSFPSIKSDMEIIRTQDGRFTLPKRKECEHEWSFKMLVTQSHLEYDLITRWYKKEHDYYPITEYIPYVYESDFVATDCFLVSFDAKYIPDKVYNLKNVYPLEVPEVTFDYENSDSLQDVDIRFAFDDINQDENGLLNQILGGINSGQVIQNLVVSASKALGRIFG